MLVLSRKVDEQILIGPNIVLKVLEIKSNKVRIGISAPNDVRIDKGETPNVSSLRGHLKPKKEPIHPAECMCESCMCK